MSLYISDCMLCLTGFVIVVALFRLWIKDERLMILRDIDLSPVLLELFVDIDLVIIMRSLSAYKNI